MLALVAHDNMKHDLAEWVDWNSKKLGRHHLVCTGTTGKMVEKTLRDHREEYEGEEEIEELPDLRITLLKSGPLGGDQQLGSLIADGKIALQRADGHQPFVGRFSDLFAAFRGRRVRTRRQGLQSLCRARPEIGWRAVLQVVRQRGGNRPAYVEVAPAPGDRVERVEQFGDVERRDELQARRLEVGQSLEIVGQMAAHFEDAHEFALYFERLA